MGHTKKFGLLLDSYRVLAPITNQWPGRSSPEGQALLSDLRENIAITLRCSDEYVQNCCESPSTPNNPLLAVQLRDDGEETTDSSAYMEFMAKTITSLLSGFFASGRTYSSKDEKIITALANAIWDRYGEQ